MANRLPFIIAILTAVSTAVTFAIAVMTPPLSGPLCEGPCFEYPYTEIISRFPRDYLWMYPAMLLTTLYLILMICIDDYAANEQKLFSRIGVAFALMATLLLLANYFVQVTVIQPSLLKGETDGIALLTQYNSHGIFIALEEISYFLMTLSFFSVVPVFHRKTSREKALRIVFGTGLPVAVAALTWVSVKHGIMREYVFEIIIISIVWLQLLITSVILSFHFRQRASKKFMN